MDERRYLELAEKALARIVSAFDEIELDAADVDSSGDVVTITFGLAAKAAGRRVVVNTQRPARQIWLAGGDRAWHFSYDEASARWMDDRATGAELFATVRAVCADAGVPAVQP